uniref:Uncharacterized protein n=1 Tax=Timema tahoe TaxID=61484 RepID=A0A7R9IDD0_9NEOP|nr:unnamed protein product [Timema tahoe]
MRGSPVPQNDLVETHESPARHRMPNIRAVCDRVHRYLTVPAGQYKRGRAPTLPDRYTWCAPTPAEWTPFFKEQFRFPGKYLWCRRESNLRLLDQWPGALTARPREPGTSDGSAGAVTNSPVNKRRGFSGPHQVSPMSVLYTVLGCQTGRFESSSKLAVMLGKVTYMFVCGQGSHFGAHRRIIENLFLSFSIPFFPPPLLLTFDSLPEPATFDVYFKCSSSILLGRTISQSCKNY